MQVLSWFGTALHGAANGALRPLPSPWPGAGPAREAASRSWFPRMHVHPGQRWVTLEQGGQRLCATPDGGLVAAAPEAEEVPPEARFLPLSDARLDHLARLPLDDWTLSDGTLVAGGDIRLAAGFVLRFGPLDIALDQGPDTLVVETLDGVPHGLRLVHDGWRADRARVLRPLIYLCVFGAETQFLQLRLLLESLGRFGAYRGQVLIVSDRPEAALLPLVPEALAGQVMFTRREMPDLNAMLHARYELDDLPIGQFQPVLYLDCDMLCDAPLMPLFAGMNTADAIFGTLEVPRPIDGPMAPVSPWFGGALFAKDPLRGRRIHALNSGSIGFSNRAIAEPVFRQLLGIARGYAAREPDHNPRFGDQPFLNYLFQKLGPVDLALLNRHIRVLRGSATTMDGARLGLLHFNRGVGHAGKHETMQAHLASLKEQA
ncbi:hypothetical protein [Falsiroseomonas selenitidurans]|uniref:Uncharacterized protein n=1 Tax=Falsiroseomonas selenitidurans TaxID=2716335 RepID=A0ABX1DZG6_9PROT|nr:hypothetical protein [Falsiroseomonas selenitidurans]NKC30302.1 hypothetical protein [Falsiroseomonas selenitidurans]